MKMVTVDPLIATGVVLATAATDAVYVMFTSAVIARRRVPAATWSACWYLLSSYAVISYTENWVYVAFAAAGSARRLCVDHLPASPAWRASGRRVAGIAPRVPARGPRVRPKRPRGPPGT